MRQAAVQAGAAERHMSMLPLADAERDESFPVTDSFTSLYSRLEIVGHGTPYRTPGGRPALLARRTSNSNSAR